MKRVKLPREQWQKHGARITVLTISAECAERRHGQCALCGALLPRHPVTVRTQNAGGGHTAAGDLCDGCAPRKGEPAPQLPCISWGVTPEQWELAKGWDLADGEWLAVPCPEHGPDPVAAADDAYRAYRLRLAAQ